MCTVPRDSRMTSVGSSPVKSRASPSSATEPSSVWLIQHLLLGQYVPDIRFSNHNTGISRIDFDGDSVMLRYLNRIDHLPMDLVT